MEIKKWVEQPMKQLSHNIQKEQVNFLFLDIWSVYLDCEIKAKCIKQTRNLFERAISLKLKVKKMQFFFKRYLEFEIEQGNTK